MQGDAVDGGHSQFGHAGLQEFAAEIAASEGTSLLQVSVGFVRIGKVGRRYNHIIYGLCKQSQNLGRGVARSLISFEFYTIVFDMRQLAIDVVL